ncbi:MAG: hypothetical protein MK101_00730 [Phycisphaerales bacterium]|nr:hypothetical protein [Phycisphaerales bacterium]
MFPSGLTTTICCTATLLLAGCGNGTHRNIEDTRYASVLNNLTPELAGLSSTQDDIRNNSAIVGNLNLRMLSDDWVRVWLFDKPSILTPYPVYDSGQQP